MTLLLLFHPFASIFYPTHDDSLYFPGKRSNGSSSWGGQQQPLGIRLQQESKEAFVYAIESPGIQSDDKWRLNLEKKEQETIIHLSVDHQQQKIESPSVVVSSDHRTRRLFAVGSYNVDAERISGKLSNHILTITVPKKHWQ